MIELIIFTNDKIVTTRKHHIFVTPAPHLLRDKLQSGSSNFKYFWMPALVGMTVWALFTKPS